MFTLTYPDLSTNYDFYSDVPVTYLTKKYGTPIVVYSMKRLYENISRLKSAFANHQVKIHYAVKANYNPYIVSRIINSGVGIDAANLNEVRLALLSGAKPSDIIATPNNLSGNELLQISQLGITINFDHQGQMETIKNHLPETVSFRINPAYAGPARTPRSHPEPTIPLKLIRNMSTEDNDFLNFWFASVLEVSELVILT